MRGSGSPFNHLRFINFIAWDNIVERAIENIPSLENGCGIWK
jgi:hypothetical protein